MRASNDRTDALRTRIARRVALGLGAVLLLGGVAAGVADRELLDEGRFARHVNALRSDAAVAAQAGDAITEQVLRLAPNLVVLKPLIQATSRQLVQSPAFDGIVISATRQFHRALTEPDSGQVVLRLADVGAVLVPVLRALSPPLAAALPADFDVTLAAIGSQDFAGHTIAAAHTVRLLTWLLPLLALACFALALALGRDRRATLGAVGVAVLASGAGLMLLAFAVGLAVRATPTDTITGALLHAGWAQLYPPVEHQVVVVLIAGAAIAAVGSAWVGALPRRARDGWAWLRRPSVGTGARFARAAAVALAGLAVLLWPVTVAEIVAAVAGLALVVMAVRLLLPPPVPAPSRPVSPAPPARSPRATTVRVVAVATVAALLLAALVAVDARPTLGDDPAAPAATPLAVCNGYAVLCDRRYDQVAYASTHNSMSAADQPGWLFAEQPDGLVDQLQHGIRGLLFDTWLGQPTRRPGLVVTASGWYAKGAAMLQQELGPQAVDAAARVRASLGLEPTGPPAPYLCHGLCENGSTSWEPEMARVAAWMRANPREVVSFVVQDEGVTPAQTDAVFRAAGLLPFVYTPVAGRPWPTLGQLIDSGHRLVVFMENQDGGTAYPWQLPAFSYIQDTPYTFHSADEFSCARLRGEADSPLFLVNHWLSNGLSRVTDSALVNSADVLGPRVSECREQRGRLPTFVAVDFYDRGDLFGVVDRLNGVG